MTGAAASAFNFDRDIARGMAAPLSDLRTPAFANPAVVPGSSAGKGRHDL